MTRPWITGGAFEDFGDAGVAVVAFYGYSREEPLTP